MIGALRLIAQDARLRVAAIGLLAMGAIAASLAPYQALIAIKVFGLSDATFSMVFALGAALSMGLAVYVGLLTDQRASRRSVAMVCASISAFGFGLVWATGQLWAYVLTALVTNPIGFSLMGQFYAIARVAVSGRPVAERDAVMSVIRAGFALPFIVILPIWAAAFSGGAALIHIYALACLAGVAMALAVSIGMPRREGAGAEIKSGLSLRVALRELANRAVALRLVLVAALVAANTTYMMTMGVIFEAVHPLGESRTAQFAALIAGLEIPFMLAIPLLTARASKASIFLGAACVYAVFLLAFPLLAATPSVWLLAVPAAMGAAALLTLPIAYFQDLLADRPGAGSSLQSVNGVASQLVASALFWLGTSLSGYGLVMALAAVLAVLAGVALRAADAR